MSIAIAGPTLIELSMRVALQYGAGNVRYWCITLVNGALFPVCAIAAFASRSLGWRSVMVSLGAFAMLWACLARSRGLWVWSGTFDAFWLSPNGWLLSALGGFAFGSLSLLGKKPRSVAPTWVAYASLAALALAALVEFAGGAAFAGATDSVYAETRHTTILGILGVLATGYFFGGSK